MEELAPLLRRAQAGEKQAYAVLVRRFQDMAVGYAYGILGDFGLAEDAAQEAFIEAFAALPKVYGPQAFPSWLRRIVFKHCDRLRRGRAGRVLPLEAAGQLAAAAPLPSETLEQRELAQAVRRAVDSLPEPQRRVVSLFYISDYSQGEIAVFLELPVTTVQKRLHDARRRLKERMSEMVKEHLHDKRPSKSEQFAQKVLLDEKFHDVARLRSTWEDFPELGARDGALELDYRYRFAIDAALKADLSAERLSPPLRQAFAAGGIELGAETEVRQMADELSIYGDMWILADRANNKAYRVRLPYYKPADREVDNELWVFNGLQYEDQAERHLLTKRCDFGDFEIAADVYILCLSAMFILRAQDKRNGYSIGLDLRCLPENEQFDSRSHDAHRHSAEKPCIEFHVRNEAAPKKTQLLSTAHYPVEKQWFRMKVVARGFEFGLFLGKDDDDLQKVAVVEDEARLYRQGAIGFGLDVGSGESSIYKNLTVSALD